MSLPVKSEQQLYDLFIQALFSAAPSLSDSADGSINDVLAGVFALCGTELQRYNVLSYNRTFFDLANGPAITGGPDDLQTLAVDHYGDTFERPGAVEALDTETFSRPTNAFGAVSIGVGTVVKTGPDANGNAQRYTTNSTVALTAAGIVTFTAPTAHNITAGAVYADANGKHYTVPSTLVSQTVIPANGTTLPPASGTLTKVSGTGDASIVYSSVSAPDCKISVGITAVVAGSAGNANAGTITTIESTLLDSTIVATNAGNATGEDPQDDSTYRETIRNLVTANRGATTPAIDATALLVPGIVTATVIETQKIVIEWNPANSTPIGQYFLIPFTTLYVADSTGTASDALVAEVRQAIRATRATGVAIPVAKAVALPLDWVGAIVLDPLGPNFAEFEVDLTKVYAAMAAYINGLQVGTGFSRALANAAMMALFGPAGTGDISSFLTPEPTADVEAPTINTKLVAGNMGST